MQSGMVIPGKHKDPLRKWPFIFFAPFAISFLAFRLYPTIYSIIISLYNWDGFNPRKWVGLSNYIRIITNDINFRLALKNTFVIVIISMPITIIFGLCMASFLSSFKMGRRLFETLNFLPYITTPVAIGLLFSFLFDWNSGYVNLAMKGFGLIDEHIFWLGEKTLAPVVVVIMIVWKNFGYYMVLYLAGISSISLELYEAAKIDGSNSLNTFFRITLPQLQPVTIFVVITGLIGGLQLFDEPVLLFRQTMGGLLGGPGKSVLTVNWYMYDTSFGSMSQWGYGSAISFVLFVIIAVFSMIGRKFMGQGDNQ
jgi:multiple sugar transport system permease protein/cellobiose transport system permease protein